MVLTSKTPNFIKLNPVVAERIAYRKLDSSVSHRLGYRLDNRGSIPGRGKDGFFSLRHSVQTGSGAYPANRYQGSYTGDKVTGA
jgi:hypothetical protein